MKKILSLSLVAFLLMYTLAGCASAPADSSKTEFIIRTQTLSKADLQWVITKSAKVQGTSEVTLTSQVSGRIKSVATTLWATVTPWAILITIDDIQWSTSFAVDKAQTAARIARDSYETQRLTLQKQIADANIAYQRSKTSYETTQADIDKQLDKARRDLASTTISATWSVTNLQIEKLQKDLEKAQFDYDTKVKADNQTRENLTLSTKTIHADMTSLLSDVLDQSDRILGVTTLHEHSNDTFDIYLGARDIYSKNDAVLSFYALNSLKTNLASLSPDGITTGNVEDYLTSYKPIIDGINTMLADMKILLLQSVPSADRFPQSQIDALNTVFNGLQSRSSALFTSINTQLNTSRTFFATYRENQESLQRNVDLLRDQIAITTKQLEDTSYTTQLWFDRTKIAADSQLTNADLALQTSKLARDLAVRTEDATLSLYQSNRRQAEIAAQEALFNRDKFVIQSPLDATVADVLVDIGQDISPGTPLVKLVSRSQQIELLITASERDGVEVGQTVTVTNSDILHQWMISSLSTVADKWGNYKMIVALPENAFTIGSFVDVVIPLQWGNVVLPLNTIDIVDVQRWQINLRDGKEIIRKTIDLGQFFGDMVEVTSSIPLTEQLILSDIAQYDPETMTLVVEQIPAAMPMDRGEETSM